MELRNWIVMLIYLYIVNSFYFIFLNYFLLRHLSFSHSSSIFLHFEAIFLMFKFSLLFPLIYIGWRKRLLHFPPFEIIPSNFSFLISLCYIPLFFSMNVSLRFFLSNSLFAFYLWTVFFAFIPRQNVDHLFSFILAYPRTFLSTFPLLKYQDNY